MILPLPSLSALHLCPSQLHYACAGRAPCGVRPRPFLSNLCHTKLRRRGRSTGRGGGGDSASCGSCLPLKQRPGSSALVALHHFPLPPHASDHYKATDPSPLNTMRLLPPAARPTGDGLCSLLVAQGREQAALLLCQEVAARAPGTSWAPKRAGFLQLHLRRQEEVRGCPCEAAATAP